MKRKTFIFFILIFFVPGCGNTGWEYVAPMPNQRYGHDATLGPDGKIYVMGGMVFDYAIPDKYNNGKYSNLVYDPQKDSWTVLEPVPGWVTRRNRLLAYNKEEDHWDDIKPTPEKPGYYEVKAPMPRKGEIRKIPPELLRNTDIQRQGDGVAIVTAKDGCIYWIGGNGKWAVSNGESIVLPYDPVNGRWPEAMRKRIYYSKYSFGDKTAFKSDVPPMNEHRIDHEAVVTSDGKIFLMGGRREELRKGLRKGDWVGTGKIEVADSVECYDPTTNKWEYRKPMTLKRFCFAAVVGPDDRIYTFGGAGEYRPGGSCDTFNVTEVYDPVTDTWSGLKPMPEPREMHAGVLGADGKIYILGGNGGGKSPPLKDVFIYDPAKDTWESGPHMKLPRSTLAAVATPGGKIYAIGGTDVGAYKNRGKINFFLPKSSEVYEGRVQDTVEVLEIIEQR